MPQAAQRWTQPSFDNGRFKPERRDESSTVAWVEPQIWTRVGHAGPDVGGAAVRSVMGGTMHWESGKREGNATVQILSLVAPVLNQFLLRFYQIEVAN